MKYLDIYRDTLGCKTNDQVFQHLIKNLKETITTWDYFVNWSKVFANIDKIEKELNLLNYLVGKDNIEVEFKNLIIEYPRLVKVIPLLVACRNKKFKVLDEFKGDFCYTSYDFNTNKDLDENAADILATGYRKTR